ncbi:MAG: hypothetical protein QXK80_01655 [Candidatus Pacearchaeota archaeon]
MSLVDKIILAGSLATILYTGCTKYAKMNVYYDCRGGFVTKQRIEIKEYKKFLWFQKEKFLLEEDSVFVEPMKIDSYKKIWRSKGITPTPLN